MAVCCLGAEAPAQSPVAPFDVVSYALDLRAAMVTEDFGGTNLITLILKTPADSVLLYQLKLQIDSVKVDGVVRPFTVSDPTERLTVRLGGIRPAGDTLRVAVAYRRLPGIPRQTDRLGYFFFRDTLPGLPANLGYTMSEPREARCWMPCYDEPWEKSTASMTVTVPAGYVVASNGTLNGTTVNGDRTITWRWQERHQIASYLICATISQWTVPTIHFLRAPGDSIPVQYFVWAADSAQTAAYLPTVRQMIANLSAVFGPYPWDKYAMAAVTPFGYGGMEHQSVTTLHRSLETSENVVVHELAHQWWGDLVTCGAWPDIWLNESFATYSEALWKESLGGLPALRAYMNGMQNFNFGSWSGAVYDPESQTFNLFATVVYTKGAWVLHTLRGAIGDSAFFRSLRKWRELYAGKSAVTADFQGAVESVTGTPMAWFFREWIYGTGWPVYSLSSRWQGGTLFVKIYQQQPATWQTYQMPVKVRAYWAGADSTFTLLDSARAQTFAIQLGVRPDSVLFDPDDWILKQRGTPVAEDWHEIPAQLVLLQNYPNPFNTATKITYDLPAVSRVTIRVFDILGREVATLLDGVQLTGTHTVSFNGLNLASGVYIYRLTAGDVVSVKKMILLK